MSRARIDRLAATVAELVARRRSESCGPIAAAELKAAGFRVHMSWNGGLSVDAAPGLDAKLDELQARGLEPLVMVLRDIAQEATA
jgi:hypothetical protein